MDPLLERPYQPPELFIFEEVEIGGGYHTLHVAHQGPERAWSEPYTKSSQVQYRNRVVKVEYPPTFETSIRDLLALHALMVNDHGDTPEAHALRDRLEADGRALSEDLRLLLAQVSEALYGPTITF
jgi:hypothetical protein